MDTGEVEYLEEYEDILRSCQNNDDTIKNLENVDKVNSFKSANKNKKKSNTSDKVNTHKGGTNISLIGNIVTVEISSILNAKEDKSLDKLEVKEKNNIKPLKTTMMQRRKSESAIKFTEIVNNPPPTPPILPEPYFVDCGPSLKSVDKLASLEGTSNSEEICKTEIENTNKMKKGEHSILKKRLSSSNQENDTSNNQFKKEKKVVKFKEPHEEKSMKSENSKVIDTKRNGKIYTKRKSQKKIKVSDIKTLIADNEEENMIKLKKTKCKNKEKQLKMRKLKVVIKKLSSKDLELSKHSVSIDKDSNVQTKEIVKKTNEKNVQAKIIIKKANEKNVQAKVIVKETNVQTKEIVDKTNKKNVQAKEIVKKTNEKNVQRKENTEMNIKDNKNEKNVQRKENTEMNIKDNKKVKTNKRKSAQKIQNNETVLKKLKVITRNKNVAQNAILNDTNNTSSLVPDAILNNTNNSNNISALTQDVVLNETNKSKNISISTHDAVLDNTNYSNSTSTLDEKKLVEKNIERKPSTTLQSKKIQSKASADSNVDDTNCVIQKTNSISSSEQLTRSNYNLLKYNEIPSFVCVETKILTSIEFQKLKNAKVNAITRLKLKEEEKISKPFIDDHRNEKNNLEMILDDIDAILQKDIFNHKDKVQCIPEENSNSVELIQQRYDKRKAILNKPEFNESSLRNILEFLKIYSSPTVATNSNDNDTISEKQNKNLVILNELNKKTGDINLSNSNSNKNTPKSHSVNESGNLTYKEQKSSLNNKIKLPQKIESENRNLNSEQQQHILKNNEELIITKISEVPTTVTPNKNADSRKTIKLPLHLLKKAITTSTPIKNLKLINQKQQENESLTFNNDLIITGNCSKIFPSECTSISDNLSNSTTTVESVQTTKTT